jgi:hypothetical protein
VVERSLGLGHGFTGHLAAGRSFDEIGARVRAGGHPSASRAGIPDAAIVDLLQAERLVECFEAVLWGGAIDLPTFREVLAAACASSHVPVIELADGRLEAAADAVAELAARWRALGPGEHLDLEA